MAKTANELNRKVLQNLRTSGDSSYVEGVLSGVAAMGEVIVQIPNEASATSLWTLAKDGETAIQFVNKETVEKMIETGASESVKELSGVVKNEIERAESAEEFLSGAVITEKTRAEAVEAELASDIETESERATSAETVLKKAVEAETARAEAAEAALDTKIDNLEDSLSGLVVEEQRRAEAAEAALDTKIETERARATSAETDLQQQIDALEEKAVSNDDGSINVITGTTAGTVINVNVKSGDHVLAKDGGNGLYTDLDIIKVTSGLSSNVKESYQLIGTDGEQIGESINIYKDSSLYSVYLGHVDDTLSNPADPTSVVEGSGDTALCFIYEKTDGTYELVAVDVESFLQETEFKDGLQVIDHEVSVKKDSTSENFLTVGPDGVKLSGVQTAIDNAVDAEETRAISAETKLREDITELSGSVSAFSASVITNEEVTAAALNELRSEISAVTGNVQTEIERAKAAETALDGVVGSVKGASDETRTYGHENTNYLNSSTTVKGDTETIDGLLGKVTEGTSADTVFTTGNTVAKNISDIKKAIATLQGKSIEGKDNAYVDVNVTESGDVQYVEATVKISEIATASADTDGLVTAYDVKEFAVNDIIAGDTKITIDTTSGVRKIDFTKISVDCGEF